MPKTLGSSFIYFLIRILDGGLRVGSVADSNPSDPYVLGLLDPDSDPLVRRIRSGSIPLSSSKNSKKTLDSFCFFILLFDFLSLKNDINVPSKRNKQKNLKN